jgi:hypothetical protein
MTTTGMASHLAASPHSPMKSALVSDEMATFTASFPMRSEMMSLRGRLRRFSMRGWLGWPSSLRRRRRRRPRAKKEASEEVKKTSAQKRKKSVESQRCIDFMGTPYFLSRTAFFNRSGHAEGGLCGGMYLQQITGKLFSLELSFPGSGVQPF